MAYKQAAYQTPNQNNGIGLGSSHCALDGVPFKIGMAFRPPPKAILPPELLQRPAPCQALHEEYTYDTEEAVLAWARAREEAKVKAAAKKEIGEKAKAAIAAAQSESDSSDLEEETPAAAPEEPESLGEDSETHSQPHPSKLPWQLQAASSMNSNTILTPMPILASQTSKDKLRSPPGEGKAQVDLAMFEQEGDPFEALELQTIDDMEELRCLLGGSNMGGAGEEPSLNPDTQTFAVTNETGVTQNEEEVVGKSGTSTLAISIVGGNDDIRNSSQDNEDRSATEVSEKVAQHLSGSRLFIEPTGEGDYVQIRSDYSQQTVSYQSELASKQTNITDLNASPGFSGHSSPLPQQMIGKFPKHVLPPIRSHGQSIDTSALTSDFTDGPINNSFIQLDESSASIIPVSYVDEPLSQSAYTFSGASDLFSVPKSQPAAAASLHQSQQATTNPTLSFPHAGGSSMGTVLGMENKYNRFGNGAVDGPGLPAVNGFDVGRNGALRSTQSTPDLSISRGGNAAQVSASQTQTPQLWNPYKPLPPPPRSYSPDPRSGSSSSPSPNQRVSPIPQPSATLITPPPEADPYSSLSAEAQGFVNTLTSMGFSRSRAARAVQKFGADEKEVLDHLLNVDKLVEKKFKPELAETGLQLFRNDIKKAEQFLDLYQQFTELGFTGERIQTALVKHQLDRDKALDYLTT